MLRLRSIEPDDEDFSDLEPLRASLEQVRIVQLGEQSHGDGSTFKATIRLVKYLHRELGFSVLAFESGLYGCREVWKRICAGEDPVAAARLGIYGIWSRAREVRPLWQYIATEAQSERPLELAGFDCRLSAIVSRAQFVDELETFVGLSGVAEALRTLTQEPTASSAAERTRVRNALDAIDARLCDDEFRSQRQLPELAWWHQVLRSTKGLAQWRWDSEDRERDARHVDVDRDELMAKNLVWLAEQRHPQAKIIVWAATSHLLRNSGMLQSTATGEYPYASDTPMGHRVAAHFGDAVYTLGFLAHHGEIGILEGEREQLSAAPTGSFEDLFARAGAEHALLDFRARPAEVFSRPRVARPCGYVEMLGDWTHVLDGFVFTRIMSGTTIDDV
jgi:erythromycin esterase